MPKVGLSLRAERATRKYNRIIIHSDGRITSVRGKRLTHTEIAKDAKFYDLKNGVAILHKR